MIWNVIPKKSVDEIEFGTTRSKVREMINLPYKEFYKTKLSRNTTDDFGVCHVYYDCNDNLEAIEVFGVDITIGGINVFDLTRETMQQLTDDFVGDDSEYYESLSLSIGIYIPADKVHPESVLFGLEDYYKK
ncbi:MAG: hypothetical protein ATN35_10780 [Epulopiscium sp. Nele67-Bin004]|nr:MAG: hypothetical protein ATN35_10780 [Epulopiscium sp. Nele67-Bin004]